LWIVGHAAGGAVIGALLGWAGSHLSGPAQWAGLGALCLLCLIWALAELRLVSVPMPQWRRQVPRTWLGRLPWDIVALGYGVQLGSGIATRIKVTTIYAALACALLAGSASAGAAVMAVFGIIRALPALLAGPAVASPERSRRMAARVDAYAAAVTGVNAAALIGAGIALSWTLWSALPGAGPP
jgi:hypothetical protein